MTKHARIRLPIRHRKEIATILLLAAVATEFVGISMGLPVMAQYAASFGIDESYVGLVFSVGAFATILSDLWLPFFSDYMGRKPTVVVSMCGSAVAYALQAAAPSFNFLLCALFIGGLCGGTQPIAVAYISDIYSPSERPRFIGMVPACSSFCFTIGPTLGGILSNMSGSYRVPLAVGAGVVTLMLPIVILFLPDSKDLISAAERDELKRAESVVVGRRSTYIPAQMFQAVSEASPLLSPLETEGDYPGVLFDWKCYTCFFVQFFSTLAFTSFVTCIPLILTDPVFHLKDEQESVFWTGIVVGCGATLQSIGLIVCFDRVQRRIGLTRTISLGTLISLVAYMFLCFQRTVIGIAIGFSIFTLGNSMTRPGNFSYVTLIVPQDHTARAIAMPNVAMSLGQMVAPIASTQLLALFGYRNLFKIVTAIVFVQLLLTFSFKKSKISKETVAPVTLPSVGEVKMSPEQYETELSDQLVQVLHERNYNLEDADTQRAVTELVARSIPFLREDESGNRDDVQRLIKELDIDTSDVPDETSENEMMMQYARGRTGRRCSVIATEF